MKSRSNRTNNGVIGTNNLNNGSNGVLSNNKNTALKSYFITDPYVRPSDWLAMPTVNVGDQKICILHAVFDTGTNFVSFRITTNTGTYTVDWGDGTTTSYTSGNVASRNYDYATVGVVNPTPSSRGYRMAMITITPTTGGATITGFNFRDHQHPSCVVTNQYSSGFLDVLMSAPNVTSVAFSGNGAGYVQHGILERFNWIGTSTVSSYNLFFWWCYSLQEVVNTPTENVTNVYGMFYHCFSLRKIPQILNTSKCTTFGYMFYNCGSLPYLPWMDTSNGTSFDIFAYGCTTVRYCPPYNLNKATTTYLMFYNCYNLVEAPPFNLPVATNISYMFGNCRGIKKIGTLTTSSSLTNIGQLFIGCPSLVEAPIITNTSNATTCSEMFTGCSSLKTLPLFDTSKVTDFSYMFSFASALVSIPNFNTSLGQNFTQMFYYTLSLQTLPAINTSAGTNFTSFAELAGSLRTFTGLTLTGAPTLTNMFTSCQALKIIPTMGVSSGAVMPAFNNLSSLQSCGITGIGQNVNFTNCQMGATALNALYTSLATVGASGAGAKTINITGNWGAATDTPSIATNKGWTVTG
jgi:surface protein